MQVIQSIDSQEDEGILNYLDFQSVQVIRIIDYLIRIKIQETVNFLFRVVYFITDYH